MKKILHLQRDCIGCDSCVEIAPMYWVMNAQGVAELRAPVGKRDVHIIAEGFEEDMDLLKEAAEACPVQIIHIKES